MKPIKDKSEFDYNTVTEEKPIYWQWCTDDYLRNGILEIINNVPVEEKRYALFWYQDDGVGKFYLYYLYKGEYAGIINIMPMVLVEWNMLDLDMKKSFVKQIFCISNQW